MTKRDEADVARGVVAELQQQGYVTYEEVSTGYGGDRADVVGVLNGHLVCVVECKTSLSLRLLDQTVRWLGKANYVVAAYGRGRGEAVSRFLKREGIGLWAVGYDSVQERVAPKLWRRCETRLISALHEEQRSGEYARAGTSGGGYYTLFRRTVSHLTLAVNHAPGITLKAALATFDHHYSSGATARSSLPALIRRGVITGIRLDSTGRELRLYPVVAPPVNRD